MDRPLHRVLREMIVSPFLVRQPMREPEVRERMVQRRQQTVRAMAANLAARPKSSRRLIS